MASNDKLRDVRGFREPQYPLPGDNRSGLRVSFYFDHRDDNHHAIFYAGDSRHEVATRLRHLAELVSREV